MQKVIFYYWKHSKIPKVPSSDKSEFFLFISSENETVFKKNSRHASDVTWRDVIVTWRHRDVTSSWRDVIVTWRHRQAGASCLTARWRLTRGQSSAISTECAPATGHLKIKKEKWEESGKKFCWQSGWIGLISWMILNSLKWCFDCRLCRT